MPLEDLRTKVLFHNSIDVWIEYCNEKNISWSDTDLYRRFISHLRSKNLNLKTFNLCAHEAGETDLAKKEFAESLVNLKASDADYSTYTIRLSDGIVKAIRAFDVNKEQSALSPESY